MSKRTLELTELDDEWVDALEATYDQGLAILRTKDGKHLRTKIEAAEVRAVELSVSLTEKKAMLHAAQATRRDQDAAVESLTRALNKERKMRKRLEKRNKQLESQLTTLKRTITPGVPPGHGSAHL